MTEIPKMPNGKNWLAKGLIQVIIILALASYIAIDKLGATGGGPQMTERIVRLEECVRRLQTVPEDMAVVKTQIHSIETTLDKIEKKLEYQK